MSDRPEWTDANGIGKDGEAAVAALFRKVGIAVGKYTERCADLLIAGRIEVKHDRLAHSTGSVAVETTYKGRPSGINATCAGSWAFVIAGTDEIILIALERLRKLVATLPDVRAGEGATIRLLRLDVLRREGVSVGQENWTTPSFYS